jgi:hypothetical protein
LLGTVATYHAAAAAAALMHRSRGESVRDADGTCRRAHAY